MSGQGAGQGMARPSYGQRFGWMGAASNQGMGTPPSQTPYGGPMQASIIGGGNPQSAMAYGGPSPATMTRIGGAMQPPMSGGGDPYAGPQPAMGGGMQPAYQQQAPMAAMGQQGLGPLNNANMTWNEFTQQMEPRTSGAMPGSPGLLSAPQPLAGMMARPGRYVGR